MLHRFIFHGEDNWMNYIPDSNYVFTLHFIIHGIHHAFPQDELRLLFPPLLGHIMLNIFISGPILTSSIPTWIAYPLISGLLFGYQLYDLTHWYFHHSNPADGTWFKKMKGYHMQHHYKHGTIGFGVSNLFWDKVFQTEITY